MICTNCELNLAECTCPDAAEKIRMTLESRFLLFGDEYRQRLFEHARRRMLEDAEKPITRHTEGHK